MRRSLKRWLEERRLLRNQWFDQWEQKRIAASSTDDNVEPEVTEIETTSTEPEVIQNETSSIEPTSNVEPEVTGNEVASNEELEMVEDAFDFTFTKSTNRRGRDFVTAEFTVTDSITDDTYTGGDEIFFEISGGWEDSRGRMRLISQTRSIDDFGPIGQAKDYAVGNRGMARLFNNADEVTVTLSNGLGSDADVFFEEVFDSSVFADTLA